MPAPRRRTPDLEQKIMSLHNLGVKAPAIAELHLGNTLSRVTVWRVIRDYKERKQNDSKRVVNEQTVRVPLADQIEHYQPALASSFNHGYGCPTSREVLHNTIKTVTKSLTPYDTKAHEMRLRGIVSGKDTDKVLGKIREILSQRMEEIFGFDSQSDKDRQFADMNDAAVCLIQLRKKLDGKTRLKPRALVDAFLISVYGERAAKVIQAIEKHLKCPTCRKPRAFAVDKNPNYYLCLSCGRQVPIDRAKFKVTLHRVDQRYLRTVQGLLEPFGLLHGNQMIPEKLEVKQT